ncbi:hypothetical protein [Lentzea jiangxiensis]|uniref:Integrase n=1 Tax=Lentzea jiangxiensis TaxID=641025 RepID=A0A1H0UH89_9PSEU|nr:hypothetical protein [Lentzea jiangxiensis]SDP65511.1 hypothetical protein SAMN05421507_1129 [Lentzea jiangxiensis]
MTAPAADDPYVLPMPAGDSPVVLPRWISPGNVHPSSRYRDMVWSLAPLIDNPSTGLVSVHWKNCPAPLRNHVKRIAWTMINGQLRPTQLKTRGHRARARTSAGEQRDTCLEWMRLARWLHARGIGDLAACAGDDWAAYAEHRRSGGIGRGPAGLMLSRLTDLWAFDGLTAHPTGVTRPVWEVDGVDDHLPAASGEAGGENTTEPLDPHVIGPLLTWAMQMVENFADDILAAWTERNRLTGLAAATASTPAGRAALEAYLSPLIQSGSPLPAVQHKGVHAPAQAFIAATTGASPMQVDRFARRHGLAALVAQRPGPCPLPVPVTGHIEGHPWRERIDFTEATTLMRHLGTAAMIICLYLTGMRPQEVQGLRSGCCTEPVDTTGPHLIRGHHYKNVTDEDGNHLSADEERELPWVAITPVVHAIRVLERIVPDGELLFSAAHHDVTRRRGLSGALKADTLSQRIDDFVLWAKREATAQGLPHQHIPDDPGGTISLTRFRRTLAWHIARRPGGLIALAVQYGHMRTVLDARTSTGYATRARRGIHGVLDVETALAAADTAARLRDRLAAGEKVSGPAARRALTAAATTPRFEGRIVPWTFARKAAAFLDRDGLILFDNPDAHLICVFKRDTALCDPTLDATAPNQYDCAPGCGNAVRTDTHARLLRDNAQKIDDLAAHSPEPLDRRLHHNADRLRTLADIHDTTAHPAEARPGHEPASGPTTTGRAHPHPPGHRPPPDRPGHFLQRQPYHRRPRRRGGRPPHGAHQTLRRPQEPFLQTCPQRDQSDPQNENGTPRNYSQTHENHRQSERGNRRPPTPDNTPHPRRRRLYPPDRHPRQTSAHAGQRCCHPSDQTLNALPIHARPPR